MHQLPELSAPDLASLLASRLCHDAVSPVGAIRTGLEMLDEDPNDAEAMNLTRESTARAVAKLQFLRIAFGASGSATSPIDLGDARSLSEGWMAFERANLTWEGERAFVPKNVAKLIMNLVLVANASVPRGPSVEVRVESVEPDPRIVVVARGKPLRVPVVFRQLVAGEAMEGPVDAQSVQLYYTLLLANLAGLTVSLEQDEASATFTAAKA
ncbi:histidine phosphotransferase ChpT [Aureimonas sp. AU4]|uniref:histidine phosphotransferase ChpT n=1 Tax=Aureimonas sp. AU4 TaxID=1638163 RepID=UPI0007854DC4|nr:histidine phosphotransferase family protein [Aureimonas sp. AU4]